MDEDECVMDLLIEAATLVARAMRRLMIHLLDLEVVVALLILVLAFGVVLYVTRGRSQHRQFSTPQEAAEFIKHTRKCYSKHAALKGNDYISVSDERSLRACLLDLSLRPSQVLVTDFIRRCTAEDNQTRAIGVGNFILFALLIKSNRESNDYKRKTGTQNLVSLGAPAYWTRKRTEYQVFLGGSCNPTTWRKDIAIPSLKEEGITYYNPQMDNWEPHLVEIEQHAKQCAQLKIFVIDNKTRGVASMVEIAYLAASKAELIVVMQDFEPGTSIDGVTLSDQEIVDLNRGHDFLCHLLHEDGIPLFDDVPTALKYAIRLIKNSESIHSLRDDLYVSEQIVRGADVTTLMDRAHIVFRQYESGHIKRSGALSLRETQLAIKSLLGIWVSIAEFQVLLSTVLTSDSRVSRDDFSCIVAGLLPRKDGNQPIWQYFTRKALGYALSTPTIDRLFPHEPNAHEYDVARDVFLGGGCGQCQRWREDIAIPLLRKKGLDYFNPNVQNWTPQLIPLEAQAKQVCSILLYFIGSDTRSIGNMVEVAHFIGQGREIVLCVNDVDSSAQIGSDELGVRAAKDLNRGRMYLQDVANRENLKIFNNIREAVHEVINIVESKRAQRTQRALPTDRVLSSPKISGRHAKRRHSRGARGQA